MIHFSIFAVFLFLTIYGFCLMIPERKMTEGKAKTLSTTAAMLMIICWLMAISGSTIPFGVWIFNSSLWFLNYRSWKKTAKNYTTPSDSEDRIKRLSGKCWLVISKWLVDKKEK